jgi:probable F420-dependent oxidoreductase
VWTTELRFGDSAESRDAAGELDDLGFGAVWLPGLDGTGILEVVERQLQATKRIAVATGVIGIWGHDAPHLAAEHARLQADYGHRFLLGLGISNAEAAHGIGGRDSFRPIAEMSAYLDALDAAQPSVEVADRILAAMGPQMVDLAARRSLGTHPFLVTPDYCAKTRSVIGKDNLLAPYVPVVLTSDRDDAHAVAGQWLGQFIGMPSYNSCLRTQGFTDVDLTDGPSERLIDAVTAWGDLDAIAARTRAYYDAGANHVALHVLGATTEYPRREWRELASIADFRTKSAASRRAPRGADTGHDGKSTTWLEKAGPAR